jgi:uncharacterized phage protein (TIGR01671 family)
MREIKFRGWDDEKLIYGSLLIEEGAYFIYNPFPGILRMRVDPETVGQYTGIKDKNGNTVWQDDIMQDEHGNRYIVKYYTDLHYDSGGAVHSGFYLSRNSPYDGELQYFLRMDECEVIGNIYETPELIWFGKS